MAPNGSAVRQSRRVFLLRDAKGGLVESRSSLRLHHTPACSGPVLYSMVQVMSPNTWMSSTMRT